MPLTATLLWTLAVLPVQVTCTRSVRKSFLNINSTAYQDLGDRIFGRDVCSGTNSLCAPSDTMCCVITGQNFPSCQQSMKKGWCCSGNGPSDTCFLEQASACNELNAVKCANQVEKGSSQTCCPRLTACAAGLTFSDSYVRCEMQYSDLQTFKDVTPVLISSSKSSTISSVTPSSSTPTASTSLSSPSSSTPQPSTSTNTTPPSKVIPTTATATTTETIQPSQAAPPTKGPTITITITISIVVTLVVVIPLPFLFLFLLRRRRAQMKDKTPSPASSRPDTPNSEKFNPNEPYPGTQELPTAPPQRPIETDGTVIYPPVEVPGSEIPPEGPQEVVGSDPNRRPVEMLGSDPATRPVEMMGSTTRAVEVTGSDPDAWNPVTVARALGELVGYPQAWSPVEVMGSTHQPVELPERYSRSWI